MALAAARPFALGWSAAREAYTLLAAVKLNRTEIAVLVVFALLIATVNAWVIVKQTGRQTKAQLDARHASLVDGRVVWHEAGAPAPADGGAR